jgi:photosystem II stability/assembly factor-like uncharacterized protein
LCLLAVGVAQAEWKKVPSETMAWLHAVYFLDDRHGWIVGSRGTLLSTKDGGSTWSFSEKVTQDTIRDVYFSDPAHGWLLCEGSHYGSGESVSYLMVTDDGGKTWQRKDAFKGRDRVVRIFFMNSRFGCAVGEGGSVWCAVENEESWRKYPLPVRFLMLDGRILNEKTLILVGGGGTALRTDDWGATWLVASTPAAHKSKVNSLFFTDDKNGWAVGVGGTVLFSRNSGQSWSDQTAPTRSELTDVFFYRPSAGFAVGDNGTIIRTSNSGADWTIEPSGTKHRLESVAATKELAFAVGFGGTVLVKEISQGGKSEIQR